MQQKNGSWLTKMFSTPKSRAISSLVILAIVLGGAYIAKNQYDLHALSSSANCYGYDCKPSVSLVGAILPMDDNSPLYADTMTVAKGSMITLFWDGRDITDCRPSWGDVSWRSGGLDVPDPITHNEKFTVTCYDGKKPIARRSISVVVAK